MSISVCDPDLNVKIKKGIERIAENMHIIANEPSLALYRLQEHVRKAMPGTVLKRMEVNSLHKELQGSCYDVEYALRYFVHRLHQQCSPKDEPYTKLSMFSHSSLNSIGSAQSDLVQTQSLLKNAVFLKQQLKYEENRRVKKDPKSTFKRLSAHLTLDLPDLPEALRETANRVESMMTQARQSTVSDISNTSKELEDWDPMQQ